MSDIGQAEIHEASKILLAGGLVGMPTETVYGLAADATNDRAVAAIFEAKGRPQFNPLIAHVSNLEMAQKFVDFPPLAIELADAFWPGPLTLILPRRGNSPISLLASAGLDSLGVRAPNHPVAQRLIQETGGPLVAPSANRSGSVSPTQAKHVIDSLGDRVGMVLDGGPCEIGVESTIVKFTDNSSVILRPGGVLRAELEKITAMPIMKVKTGAAIEAPGMMQSHYAPKARVRLHASSSRKDEAFLGFGVQPPVEHSLNLSVRRNLSEAAANLFAHLRALDEMCSQNGLSGIAVAPIPDEGLGEAINDRLARAAATK